VLIVEETAAAFLTAHGISIRVYEDGRIALIPPDSGRFVALARRIWAMIAGRTPATSLLPALQHQPDTR
jgi:hypothetical protein